MNNEPSAPPISADGKWWWDGRQWRPVRPQKSSDPVKILLWAIGAPAVGIFSLVETAGAFSGWFHPWIPAIGLTLSVITFARWRVTKVSLLGVLAISGLILNVLAGIAVLYELH